MNDIVNEGMLDEVRESLFRVVSYRENVVLRLTLNTHLESNSTRACVSRFNSNVTSSLSTFSYKISFEI